MLPWRSAIRSSASKRGLRVASYYLIFGSLWILFSDQVLRVLALDGMEWQLFSTAKGLLFVTATSVLLWSLAVTSVPLEAEELPEAPRGPRPWLPAAVVIAMTASFVLMGWGLFRYQRDLIRSHRQQQLATAVALKAEQIQTWLNGRLDVAHFAARKSPLARDLIKRWEGGFRGVLPPLLEERLETLQRSALAESVFLLDADLKLRGASPRSVILETPPQEAAHALSRGLVTLNVVSGLKPRLEILAPIQAIEEGARSVGLLVFRITPLESSPIFQGAWPTPEKTGEFMLAMTHQLQIHFFSLTLRGMDGRPLQAKGLPAAFSGMMDESQGSGSGLDDRGKDVLLAHRKLHGLPWVLFARLDAQEVDRPVLRAAGIAFGLTLVLVMAAAFGAHVWWRKRKAEYLARLYRSAMERRALVKHFEFLSKHANDIVVLVDDSQRIVHVNDRAIQAYGWQEESLGYLKVDGLCSPSAREAFLRNWMDTTEQGARFTSVHKRRDGSEFPVEVSSRLILLEGRPFRQGIVRDISDQVRLETQLRESEQHYRAVVENTADVIMRFDREHRHLFVSPAIRNLLPLDPQAFIGKTHHDMGFPSDLVAMWESHIQMVFDTGEPVETEFTLQSDPRRSIIDWRLFPEFDAQGQVQTVLTIARDITEQREVQADYRMLFDRMLDGFALLQAVPAEGGSEFRLLDLNPAFERMTGISAIHGVGQGLQALMPTLSATWMEQLQQTVETGRPIRLDAFPASEDRHLEALFYRPRPGQVAVLVQDTTERWRAEQQRNLALTRLEEIKRALDVAAMLMITDASGRITSINDAVLHETGFTREELLGQNPRVLSSHYHPKSFWESLWDTVQSGAVWKGEVRNRTKDGRIYWLDTTVVPFMDPEGKPQSYLSIRFDVTARREAQDRQVALAQEREAMLEAASVAKVVPWSLDLQTNILRVGESSLTVLGRESIWFHAEPRRLKDLLQKEDHHLFAHAESEALAGRLGAFEAPMPHGSGRMLWTRWTMACRSGSLLGVIQDNTEAHDLQSQVIQGQKLESLGTLVGGVTHDFNNVLMSIQGYTEVLSLAPGMPPAARHGLDVILRATERGRSLVGKLLNFSRKPASSMVLGSLNALVEEVRSMISFPGESRIQFHLELAADLPDILMDGNQMHQVLMNLVVNARDAIRGEGSIFLKTGSETLAVETALMLGKRPGTYQFVELRDTGVGIPPDLLPRIFEPFFTTKGTGKGTGLGLSVAHGIVETHGGMLQCESQVGLGTTFRVRLPELRLEELEQEASHERLEHRSYRILMVDEPSPAADATLELLAVLQHRVLRTLDPAQAGHWLSESGMPDLLIVNMGALQGTLLEAWRQCLGELPACCTVVASATPHSDLRVLELPRTADAILAYPLAPAELLGVMTRLLG